MMNERAIIVVENSTKLKYVCVLFTKVLKLELQKKLNGKPGPTRIVRKFTVAGRPNTSSKLSNKHTETKTPKFPDARFS